MKSFLFSAAAKLGLFVFSIGLGMGSYLMVQKLEAEPEALSREEAPIVLEMGREIVIDAEAHLLARTCNPVDATGDALGIHYILQRDGKLIRVAPEIGGVSTATTYAQLADGATDLAIGFSSLVLHPNFLAKEEPGYGCFYIIVAERAGTGKVGFAPEFGSGEHHQDVLYEYTVEDPLLTEFRGTRRELMRFRQPGKENNLRGLAFDPRGLLYLGVGDGAAAEVGRNSPSRNASSLANAYGKILRIDPVGRDSGNGAYGIPDGNPFRLVSGALPELWVFGLRAPHSLAYDPFRRGLCIAERGASQREKINVSLVGGEHFGWDIAEAPGKLGRAARAQLAGIVTAPEVELDLRAGLVAPTAGSLVYRGESFPSLAGAIIFASHDGQLLAKRSGTSVGDGGQSIARIETGSRGGERYTALRPGPRGEMLLLCDDGRVLEMRKGASLGNGASKRRSLYCGNAATAADHG